MTTTTRGTTISPADNFIPRHVGPSEAEVAEMLALLGYATLDELIDATIPAPIRLRRPLAIHERRSEHEALAAMRAIAAKNRIFRSYLGFGYHDTLTPPVIQRNILENPGWYTAYTPYQAEISQGRLEALLNFQTMVIDLTGLQIANASLLDEGTAAAEAMFMAYQARGKEGKTTFFIDARCHPQTIDVVETRARARGIEDGRRRRRARSSSGRRRSACCCSIRPPTARCVDYREVDASGRTRRARWSSPRPTCSRSRCSTPPGEWGADICVGNSQRFGVPLGYGGPHAAFFATQRRVQAHAAGPHHRREPRRDRAAARCAWRSRRASSTSAARRRRATSARRRCCSP